MFIYILYLSFYFCQFYLGFSCEDLWKLSWWAKRVIINFCCSQCLFSSIFQKPLEKYSWIFVDGTRVMSTSGLVLKNISSVQPSTYIDDDAYTDVQNCVKKYWLTKNYLNIFIWISYKIITSNWIISEKEQMQC